MKVKPHSKNPLSSHGFTLVELLIVIVIIATLVAIGFPLANKVRASANRTQCLNRLHSWGIAFGGYAADHDGKINFEHWPSIGNNPLTASPYIPYWTGDISDEKTGFDNQLTQRYCPAVKWDGKSNKPVCYSTIQPVGITKVGITGRSEKGLSSDYPLSKITSTNRFMLMLDTTGGAYTIQTSGDFTTYVKPLTVNGPNLRHNHYVNVLFADFAVKPMSWPEIEKGLSYWTTF